MAFCGACGAQSRADARVCVSCGQPLPGGAPARAAKSPELAGTMIGFAGAAADPAQPTPAPTPAAKSPLLGTMIGFGAAAASPTPAADATPTPRIPADGPPTPRVPMGKTAGGAAASPDFGRTMLGFPSAGPRSPEAPPATPPPPLGAGPAAPTGLETLASAGAEAPPKQGAGLGQTRQGLAPPGISASPPVELPPRDSEQPAAPERRVSGKKKKRARYALPHHWPWFFAGGLCLMAAAGASIGYLTRPPEELRVLSFETTQNGEDALFLECRGCTKGARLKSDGMEAPYTEGRIRLPLAKHLAVGSNRIELTVTEPSGTSTQHQLDVPVAFRIDTKLLGLDDGTPRAVVQVAAPAEASVRGDGQALPHRDGLSEWIVSLEGALTGEAPQQMRLSREVTVEVSSGAGAQSSRVHVSADVTPLVLDVPWAKVVVADLPAMVRGSSLPGASVRVGSVESVAGPDGRFAVQLPAMPGSSLTVSAQVPGQVRRFATIELRRQPTPKGAAAARADYAPGLETEVNVRILESRNRAGSELAVGTLEGGCESRACLVRLELAQPWPLRPGPAKLRCRVLSTEPAVLQVLEVRESLAQQPAAN